MMSNELYHYGVPGMKWGVRRYQNKDGSLTPAGKKRYSDEANDADEAAKDKARKRKIIAGTAAATVALAAIGAAGVYAYKTSSYRASISLNSLELGKYAVDEMDLDDMIIPKGRTMFRTSTQQTLRDGPVFMSINKDDKNRYIHRMGDMYKNLHQLKIKSTKDLKIPSEKKQMELFVDLLTNDKDFSKAVTYNPYGESKNVFGSRSAAASFAKNYHYENFITRMIDYSPSKRDNLSKFADYVKSKGYDGLIDVNDIRTTADKPIIILGKDNLVVDSSKKVNLGMKFVAGLNLKNVKVQ
jgi:hypothetical protein